MSMNTPPESIVLKTREELESLRGQAGEDSNLIDQLVTEILLCGRIWSQEHKDQLNFPTLCHVKGRLHTNLRACLAYHELKRLDAYNWKDLGSLRRNDRLSDTIFRAELAAKKAESRLEEKVELAVREITDAMVEAFPEVDYGEGQAAHDKMWKDRIKFITEHGKISGDLKAAFRDAVEAYLESVNREGVDFHEHLQEITKEEKNTLDRLGIRFDWVVKPVVLKNQDQPVWDQLERDLYHVSYDSVQKVIDKNLQVDYPDPDSEDSIDASGYFSLTISEIFQETIESFITEPTGDDYKALENKNETFGILYMIDQHSLITAPEPFEKLYFLDELERRLKERASDRCMNISKLRLRCSNATKLIKVGNEDWVTEILIDDYKFDPEVKALKDNIQELRKRENHVIQGWGGKLARSRQSKVMYIDAVHLSNQIWGPIGNRESIKAFMRSIRITPYMDIVFGSAIASVDNSFKLLHGGDDFLLSYDKHSIGREDLVEVLRSTELEALLGVGRWHKVDSNSEKDNQMRVIGSGFALPFWWWSETDVPDRDDENDFKDNLKVAKDERRQDWLLKATRNEVQIHP